MIRFHNTLTGEKEVFKPLAKGKVSMYTCGPTVYSPAHIGNMRSFLFSDFVKRVLVYNGLSVKHIMNYTDVGHLVGDGDEGEDRVEKAARTMGKSADEITDDVIRLFEADLKRLNIIFPQKFVRATEHIKEQIALIEKLEKKGYTYKTADGIYFDTTKMKDYGKLAGFAAMMRKAGARVTLGGKKHATDFALWKFSGDKKRLQEWKSPWGIGFPGWHIECSAMAMKYLGEQFDVHTGGQDLSQVHHNNEIAQSECATGKQFVKYWLHGGFLVFNGEKVSKSTGGLYTVAELEEKGYNPEAYRYLCLLTHYRKPLTFTLENLDAAQNAYDRLRKKVFELRSQKASKAKMNETYSEKFLEAVNDDINLPEAVAVMWEMLGDATLSAGAKLKLLERFDEVLGLNILEMKARKILPNVDELKALRDKARKEKDWVTADRLRKEIEQLGYVIIDTPNGSQLYC